MNAKTYCSKSWTDINIDFQNKTLQHCCKSLAYDFPKKLTFDFFNNSNNIQQRRRDTLLGIQHRDCNFCWQNINKNIPSYKDFMNIWDDEFVNNNILDDSLAAYIEIKLDNTCDMACLYCSAKSSSKIAKEEKLKIKQNKSEEDYKLFTEWLFNYFAREDLIYKKINIVFIGGEPTYNKRFFEFIDKISQLAELYTRYEFTIGLITNCNTLPKTMDKLTQIIETSFLHWNIIVSNESTNETAELVRTGLNWLRFETNLKKYLSLKNVKKVTFLPTVSILTIKNLPNYVTYIQNITIKFDKDIFWNGNYVEYPYELDVSLLPPEYKKYAVAARNNFETTNVISQDRFINFLNSIENRIGKRYNPNWFNDIETFIKKKSFIKNNTKILELLKEI